MLRISPKRQLKYAPRTREISNSKAYSLVQRWSGHVLNALGLVAVFVEVE